MNIYSASVLSFTEQDSHKFTCTCHCPSTVAAFARKVMPLTVSVVDQQAVGAPHINVVTNLHVLQILGHLSTVWELWVHILEVHLQANSNS